MRSGNEDEIVDFELLKDAASTVFDNLFSSENEILKFFQLFQFCQTSLVDIFFDGILQLGHKKVGTNWRIPLYFLFLFFLILPGEQNEVFMHSLFGFFAAEEWMLPW